MAPLALRMGRRIEEFRRVARAVAASGCDSDERGQKHDTVEARRLLGLVRKTLARYGCKGTGPVFCRFGNRVRYRREALDDWAQTRRRASTVDDGTVLPGATP